MPIRSRMLEIEDLPQDEELLASVWPLWEKLGKRGVCPFCWGEPGEATFPWRYRHHNVYGKVGANGPASVCMGSRSVYTLKLLGLDAVL